jgi:hypothetical protein
MSCVRANIPITACEGATFDHLFFWKTGPEKTPIDLTGYSGACHVREKITSEGTVFNLTTGNGVNFEDQIENTGGYRIVIPKEGLEGICDRHRERVFVYDLFLIDPDGNVKVQQYGTITIVPVVTRTWT